MGRAGRSDYEQGSLDARGGWAVGTRLEILQVFRGIAAMLVVAFHVTWYTPGEPFLWRLLLFGGTGVDFFFVLSGFLMAWVHWEQAGERARALPFLKARFVRIYPTYWVVLLLFVAYAYARPGFNDGALSPAAIGSAILLWSGGSVVPVAWTLSFEMAFYLFFAVFFVLGRVPFAILSAMWCGRVLLHVLGYMPSPHTFVFSQLILEFFLGCVIAWIIVRWRPTLGAAWVVAAALLLVAVGIAYSTGVIGLEYRISPFGPLYALLILTAVCHELSSGTRQPRVLVFVGEASYSIYLTHYALCLELLTWLWSHPRAEQTIGRNPARMLVIVVLTLVGILFHTVVERPLQRLTRRWLSGGRG